MPSLFWTLIWSCKSIIRRFKYWTARPGGQGVWLASTDACCATASQTESCSASSPNCRCNCSTNRTCFLQTPHFRFVYHHHHHHSPGLMTSVLFRIARLQCICLFGIWRSAEWGKDQKEGKGSRYQEKTCKVSDNRSWSAGPQQWQRWRHSWFWQWQRWWWRTQEKTGNQRRSLWDQRIRSNVQDTSGHKIKMIIVPNTK